MEPEVLALLEFFQSEDHTCYNPEGKARRAIAALLKKGFSVAAPDAPAAAVGLAEDEIAELDELAYNARQAYAAWEARQSSVGLLDATDEADMALARVAADAMPTLLAALRTTATPEPAAASVAGNLREATTGAVKVWLLYNESDEVVGAYTDEAAATAAIEYDRSFLAWPSPAESYTVREIEVESGKGGADAAQ